jgi:hypothetical protein
MVPIDHLTVVRGCPSVRPHVVLIAANPLETQGRRNTAQDLRRQRSAKPEQHVCLVDTDLRHRIPYELADRHLRRHTCHGVECRSNRSDATAQPTDGAGQGNVRPAQRVGSGLHALGRQCHGDTVFDRDEQARQSGGKEVRKQAERSMALGAIPPRDTQSSRRYSPVAAMTNERAAAQRMQWAAGQLGVTPFMVPDVRVDARRCSQRDLQ